MDKMMHRLKNMGNHGLLVCTGESSLLQDFVHPQYGGKMLGSSCLIKEKGIVVVRINGLSFASKVFRLIFVSGWCHQCPFGKIDGPGKWNKTNLNQWNQSISSQTNLKRARMAGGLSDL